ncbi:DUF4817 domain-containing protein [Trichonephila clavipes]|nr:DUF4817 domain-containing protein [Trichonephila clavipes]
MHFRERKLLSGIDVSEKAGKVSKMTYALQTSRTAENIEKVSAVVRKNRLQTIAESVEISSPTWQWILIKDLNMHRVCQHIIPRMLNDQSADEVKSASREEELWFQQDGATWHTARTTIDLLKDTFGDRLISRFGPVNRPPRSCDLTPLYYFLWGHVKSLVYADKPQTLDHLEDNIRRVIADIRPQMLEKVIENWTSRLDYIRASRVSPMPEVIFKM